jgi:hypothetical protein
MYKVYKLVRICEDKLYSHTVVNNREFNYIPNELMLAPDNSMFFVYKNKPECGVSEFEEFWECETEHEPVKMLCRLFLSDVEEDRRYKRFWDNKYYLLDSDDYNFADDLVSCDPSVYGVPSLTLVRKIS